MAIVPIILRNQCPTMSSNSLWDQQEQLLPAEAIILPSFVMNNHAVCGHETFQDRDSPETQVLGMKWISSDVETGSFWHEAFMFYRHQDKLIGLGKWLSGYSTPCTSIRTWVQISRMHAKAGCIVCVCDTWAPWEMGEENRRLHRCSWGKWSGPLVSDMESKD